MSEPRKEVQWFSEQMEAALKANDHKGGWYDCEEGWLLRRLSQELQELRQARTKGREAVIKECADIANFAMMIADNREKQWGYDERDKQPTPQEAR